MSDITLVKNDGALDVSRPTDSDLSGDQYRFVEVDSDELAVTSQGSGNLSYGVLQNAPDGSSNQETAEIRVQGNSKLEAGESIDVGDPLKPDGDGKAQTASAGDTYSARALTGADSGDLFSVIVERGDLDS